MKFNKKIETVSKTTNLAGGEAYKETPKLEFVSILLTSFVENQFYESKEKNVDRLTSIMNTIPDKKFLAKASIFARNEFGMRSITHVTAAELAKEVKGQSWMKNYMSSVVYRPDDITEILAYYMTKYGKPVPNSMKKGLGNAFGKFDAYQLAKYRGEGKAVSLIDAVNILHPRPTDKNKDALKLLVEGKLKSTDTWESKLTKAGQEAKTEEEKDEFKAQAWKDLISERKIGYFALLRNLRNILEQSPEMIDQTIAMLTDKNLIKKSLVMPFRFQTAMNEIKQTNFDRSRNVIVALDKALELSCDNVPKFEGKTLVAVDISGSMQGKPSEIASLFAALLIKSNNCDLMLFNDNAKYVSYNPNDSVMTLAKSFTYTPSGTDFKPIFNNANKAYDRVIILSDMQSWIGYNTPKQEFSNYKRKYSCNPKIYSFDLTGLGSLQFPENNVFALAGFSDKIFDIMKLMETDKNALLHKIEEVKL